VCVVSTWGCLKASNPTCERVKYSSSSSELDSGSDSFCCFVGEESERDRATISPVVNVSFCFDDGEDFKVARVGDELSDRERGDDFLSRPSFVL